MTCKNCLSPASHRTKRFFSDEETCLVCGFSWVATGTGLTWLAAVSAFALAVVGSNYSEPGEGDHRTG